MSTGEIRVCEEETHHTEIEGRHTCYCGYRTYPCHTCGEKEVHKPDCAELLARKKKQENSHNENRGS